MEFDGSNDNLKMYDIATQSRSELPEINPGLHEAHPSLSGDWLLFTRSKPGDWQKVILFNLSTWEHRVLFRSALGRQTLQGDQVNGDWATFEHCHYSQGQFSNCAVFRSDLNRRPGEDPEPGPTGVRSGCLSGWHGVLLEDGEGQHV
jgi:hypothetical protein